MSYLPTFSDQLDMVIKINNILVVTVTIKFITFVSMLLIAIAHDMSHIFLTSTVF